MFEQSPENAPPRPPLAPPYGPVTSVTAVFWNERELRAGWRLAIFVLFFFLFVSVGSFLVAQSRLLEAARSSNSPGSMIVQEGVVLLAAVAAAAIMGLAEGRPFGSYGLPRAGAFGARFWQGAAWGIAMITAMIAMIRIFGGFSFGGLALRGAEIWRNAALWGAAFLCVALLEEFLFRGYAQFTLATGVGFWPAATALSAAFGALHLRNSGEDRIGALGVFVIAMFFCLTLRRTGNLWFAVGLHSAFDWGETFLFSVPDSGIVAPGHLLNTSLHGAAWLTGGTVGPEASVMAFVVVALAAAIFARVYRGSSAD
jgi:membrane protease YdiL (CAAX protease family)